MSAKIEKIVLNIGDKEIDLSLDEAKELKSILNKLFGTKETVIWRDRDVYIPRPYPVWIQRREYPDWSHWDIICTSDSNSTSGALHLLAKG